MATRPAIDKITVTVHREDNSEKTITMAYPTVQVFKYHRKPLRDEWEFEMGLTEVLRLEESDHE